MAGIKQRGAICGGLLIAAAVGSIAVAEDDVIQKRQGPVSRPLADVVPPSPDGEPLEELIPTTPTLPAVSDFDVQCPTRPPGFFARFKERCRAKYWGYPEEFYARPAGSIAKGYELNQIANGQAARMVLHQYDFQADSPQLTHRGKAELARIAQWLPTNPFPVFVEPTEANPELDELRRQTVWNEFNSICGLTPSERVIIGRPGGRGLYAAESLLIDRSRLGMTATRGNSTSGGGSGGPGMSANSSNNSATVAR